MAKPPLFLGLGAAIFLIQALLVGISAPSMLAASLIVLLLILLMIGIKHVNALQPDKIIQSLQQAILPLLRIQLGNSVRSSQQAFTQLASKLEHLRIELPVDDARKSDANCDTAKQGEETLNDILVLLQFGDRLEQQQRGAIESLELIEKALEDAHKLGWNEQELRESINRIEQKTRIKNNKSPQDEGKVTYF